MLCEPANGYLFLDEHLSRLRASADFIYINPGQTHPMQTILVIVWKLVSIPPNHLL